MKKLDVNKEESQQSNEPNSLQIMIDRITRGSAPLQEELAFYRTMFQTLIQHAPVSMYILEDWAYSYVNPQFCKLVGYTEQDMAQPGMSIERLIHPDDLHIVRESVQRRIENKEQESRYRVRGVRKDGSIIHVEVHATRAVISDKTIIFGSVIDITEEVMAQLQLEEQKESFKSLFDHNPDAVFTFDLEGNFIDANEGCEHISGYRVNELLDMSFIPLIVSEDLPKTLQHFEEATRGITSNYDVTITGKDGKRIQLNVTNFPMKVKGKIVGAYGIAKDVSERVQYHQEMEKLAFYDPLTKLPNRKLFEDRLQQALHFSKEHGQTLAVLFLDLDRFKFINDSLGHHLGDEFLKLVSKRLNHNLRKTDTIARLAGDEFAILLPRASKDETVNLAKRIIQVLERPFSIQGHSATISASIGIAFSDGTDKKDAQELIKNADTAMYCTKRQGKNHYTIYSDELDLQASYKLTLERDLKWAVQNEELSLYYQPIFDLKTGEVNAMEALLRWNHPQLGLVPPNDFIPIAEESGQIISIGKWVLETACAQNKQWQNSGIPPFKVAVNISIKQLQHHSFIETVKQALDEAALDPKWLDLEITESILMVNTELTKESFLQLKELGVSISIDDFGTGYTSLSYLRQYAFDKVKIDRSFIDDISRNLNGKEITSSIIALAHNLKMGVAAEGIEDDIQLAYLKQENCDEGQGYFFSKPLPAHSFQFPFDIKKR